MVIPGTKASVKNIARSPTQSAGLTADATLSNQRRLNLKTKVAQDLIGQMYKVEDDIRKLELEGDKKRDYRQQKAKPLVDPFFTGSRKQLCRLDPVPSHSLSKAPGYVQKREMELRVYLDDPSVDIDTHHLE